MAGLHVLLVPKKIKNMDHNTSIIKWIQSKVIQVKENTTTQNNDLQDVHCLEEESALEPSIFISDCADQSESSQVFNAGKLDNDIVQQLRSSHQPLLSNLDRILPGINHVHQNTGELKKEFPQEEEQMEYSLKNKPKTTLDGCVRYSNLNLAPISEEYKNSQKLPEISIITSNGRKNFTFEVDMGDGVVKQRPAPFHNKNINTNKQLTSKLQQKMKQNQNNSSSDEKVFKFT